MNKLSLAIAAASAIALVSLGANAANAQYGFGFYTYTPTVYPVVYTTNYPTTVYPVTPIYGNVYSPGYTQIDSDHVWHDESHVHYIPPKIVQHKNHFHVVPGRYKVHQTGHLHHLHD